MILPLGFDKNQEESKGCFNFYTMKLIHGITKNNEKGKVR